MDGSRGVTTPARHSSIAVTSRYLDHLTNDRAVAPLAAVELPPRWVPDLAEVSAWLGIAGQLNLARAMVSVRMGLNYTFVINRYCDLSLLTRCPALPRLCVVGLQRGRLVTFKEASQGSSR